MKHGTTDQTSVASLPRNLAQMENVASSYPLSLSSLLLKTINRISDSSMFPFPGPFGYTHQTDGRTDGGK